MSHAVLVLGLVFSFGFLMVIGLLTVLRDLLARPSLVPAMFHDNFHEVQGSRGSGDNGVPGNSHGHGDCAAGQRQ